MGYMRKLFEAYPWAQLIPDQSVIKNENTEDAGYQMAAVSENKDFMFAYSPTGKPLKIDLAKFSISQLKATWFNPRDGVSTPIGAIKNEGIQEFKPPVACPTCDWTLVISNK